MRRRVTERLVAVAALMLGAGLTLRAMSVRDSVPAARLDRFPRQIGEWRGHDEAPLDPSTLAVLQADAYLLRTFEGGRRAQTLFVAYYSTQQTGHTVHSPLNCLPGTGWEWRSQKRESLDVGGGRVVELNRGIARKDDQRVLVSYWYQSAGRAVASEYAYKLLLVRNALTRHRSDGAIVRVTSSVLGDDADQTIEHDTDPFIRAVHQPLTESLPE